MPGFSMFCFVFYWIFLTKAAVVLVSSKRVYTNFYVIFNRVNEITNIVVEIKGK